MAHSSQVWGAAMVSSTHRSVYQAARGFNSPSGSSGMAPAEGDIAHHTLFCTAALSLWHADDTCSTVIPSNQQGYHHFTKYTHLGHGATISQSHEMRMHLSSLGPLDPVKHLTTRAHSLFLQHYAYLPLHQLTDQTLLNSQTISEPQGTMPGSSSTPPHFHGLSPPPQPLPRFYKCS